MFFQQFLDFSTNFFPGIKFDKFPEKSRSRIPGSEFPTFPWSLLHEHVWWRLTIPRSNAILSMPRFPLHIQSSFSTCCARGQTFGPTRTYFDRTSAVVISGRGHDAPNSCSGENTCASSTVVESVSVKDSGSGSRCSCRCAWCSCSGKGAHDSATSVISLNSRRRLAAAQQPCSAAAAGR